MGRQPDGDGDIAVATLGVVFPSLLQGMKLGGVATATNTVTNPKLRVVNLGSTGGSADFPILKEDGTALAVGDIKSGRRYRYEADGAGNVLISGGGLGNGLSTSNVQSIVAPLLPFGIGAHGFPQTLIDQITCQITGFSTLDQNTFSTSTFTAGTFTCGAGEGGLYGFDCSLALQSSPGYSHGTVLYITKNDGQSGTTNGSTSGPPGVVGAQHRSAVAEQRCHRQHRHGFRFPDARRLHQVLGLQLDDRDQPGRGLWQAHARLHLEYRHRPHRALTEDPHHGYHPGALRRRYTSVRLLDARGGRRLPRPIDVADVSAVSGFQVGWQRKSDGTFGPLVPTTAALLAYVDGKRDALALGGYTFNAAASGQPAELVYADTDASGRVDLAGLVALCQLNSSFTHHLRPEARAGAAQRDADYRAVRRRRHLPQRVLHPRRAGQGAGRGRHPEGERRRRRRRLAGEPQLIRRRACQPTSASCRSSPARSSPRRTRTGTTPSRSSSPRRTATRAARHLRDQRSRGMVRSSRCQRSGYELAVLHRRRHARERRDRRHAHLGGAWRRKMARLPAGSPTCSISSPSGDGRTPQPVRESRVPPTLTQNQGVTR